MGSAGTRSRVLAFGTVGSRVPGFHVIAISGSICILPLAIIIVHRSLVSSGNLTVFLCYENNLLYAMVTNKPDIVRFQRCAHLRRI